MPASCCWLPVHGISRASTERPLQILGHMLASTVADDAACVHAVNKCADEVNSYVLAVTVYPLVIFMSKASRMTPYYCRARRHAA